MPPGYPAFGIRGSHLSMTNFDSSSDSGYRCVQVAIHKQKPDLPQQAISEETLFEKDQSGHFTSSLLYKAEEEVRKQVAYLRKHGQLGEALALHQALLDRCTLVLGEEI